MIEQLKTIREFVESVHEGEWLPYVDRANTIAALTQLEAMAGEQEPVAEVMPRRIGPGHGTPEKFTYDVNWFTVDPHKWSGKLFAAPPAQQEQPTDDAILKERDEAEDFIDALLDEVLGADRPEWSSAYGRAEALAEVQERMTALHKPMVDKAWQRFEQAQAEAAPQVAVYPAPVITVWGSGMDCVDIELSRNETATVFFDRSALALAEKRIGFAAAPQQKGGV